MDGAMLATRAKDIALFESLAAINERFAKLQDTLGVAMGDGDSKSSRTAACVRGTPYRRKLLCKGTVRADAG